MAIVGPKGSGKTALADIIARAAGAPIHDESSFLRKAAGHLGDAEATLHWVDETASASPLHTPAEDVGGPWVRYLSQQFVDRLCSSDHLGRELLDQIESVVFQAIPDENRLGATSFAELRALRLDQIGRMREAHLVSIQRCALAVAEEDQNRAVVPEQQRKLDELKRQISREEKEIVSLLPADKKDAVARLSSVTATLDAKTRRVQDLALQSARCEDLELEYGRLRRRWSDDLEELEDRYRQCGLADTEWGVLVPSFADNDIAAVFAKVKARTDAAAAAVRSGANPRDEGDLVTWALADLQALQAQLSQEIGVEKERARKYADLVRRLATTKKERDAVEKELEHLAGAEARRQRAIEGRREAYAAVFETLVQEQRVLNELYAPLKAQLADEADVERRLDLHVHRRVDVKGWVEAGELLLDLRRAGPFQGRGALESVVSSTLAPAWQDGGAEEVATAMETFIKEHMLALMNARRATVTLQDLGRWLFSTEHVALEYGLRYEGVDLVHLSPACGASSSLCCSWRSIGGTRDRYSSTSQRRTWIRTPSTKIS